MTRYCELSFFIIAACIGGFFLILFYQEQGDCQQEQNLYNELRKSKTNVELQLDNWKDKFNNLENELSKYSQKLRKLEDEIYQCKTKNEIAKHYISSLENKSEALVQDLQDAEDEIRRIDRDNHKLLAELNGHGKFFDIKANLFGGYVSFRTSIDNPMSSSRIESDSHRRRRLN